MEDSEVKGAEGIVIHGNKIVLGMQKSKRWYSLENGENATIVKTLGGSIEEEDNENSRNALIRELLEEVKGIEKSNLKVSDMPLFTKHIKMKDLNPYEKESNLDMQADFYLVEIPNNVSIKPNDLPALIEIPIDRFFKLELSTNSPLFNIENYLVKNSEDRVPENYAIMAPKEVKDFLRQKGDEER